MNEELKVINVLGEIHILIMSKKLSRAEKLRLYTTAIKPTVMYSFDISVLSKNSGNKLAIWQRKILRMFLWSICG